jgi:hypothetical protein
MATPVNCLSTALSTNDTGAHVTGGDAWDTPTGQYIDLGKYIECTIPSIWTSLQIIFIAAAIIIVLYLIYRTATNRDNSSVMEELMKQWPYVLLLAIVVIGGAGTILNMILVFFGFRDVQYWLTYLSGFLNKL